MGPSVNQSPGSRSRPGEEQLIKRTWFGEIKVQIGVRKGLMEENCCVPGPGDSGRWADGPLHPSSLEK